MGRCYSKLLGVLGHCGPFQLWRSQVGKNREISRIVAFFLLVNVQEKRVGGFPLPRSSVDARTMLLLKNAGHRNFRVGPPQ
jgi:hypothetical protein